MIAKGSKDGWRTTNNLENITIESTAYVNSAVFVHMIQWRWHQIEFPDRTIRIIPLNNADADDTW